MNVSWVAPEEIEAASTPVILEKVMGDDDESRRREEKCATLELRVMANVDVASTWIDDEETMMKEEACTMDSERTEDAWKSRE